MLLTRVLAYKHTVCTGRLSKHTHKSTRSQPSIQTQSFQNESSWGIIMFNTVSVLTEALMITVGVLA